MDVDLAPAEGESASDPRSSGDRLYESWGLKEAARYLKVHEDTCAKLAKAGQIPGTKIGRAWVFLPDLLREYLRDRSIAAKPRAHSPRRYETQSLAMELRRLRERRADKLLRRAR
jgi:excisionase family DNA binding protein